MRYSNDVLILQFLFSTTFAVFSGTQQALGLLGGDEFIPIRQILFEAWSRLTVWIACMFDA